MKYRNTLTGTIVDIESKITGGNWELIITNEPPVVVKEKTIEPKTPKKRSKE